MTDNKGPSFSTRCKVLAQAAQDLAMIADLVGDEAKRMAAAEKRFSERRGRETRKASR
jgi:hypothetical protein